MNVVTAKLTIAMAIFLISFLSAVAPLKVIRMNDQFFSVGNLLASGVLLAAGLVHQLPDAMENLQGLSVANSDFPLGPFIAGLTFCAFLIFEEYMHVEFEGNPFHSHRGRDSQGDNHENHDHDHDHHDHDDHNDVKNPHLYAQTEEQLELEIQRLIAVKNATHIAFAGLRSSSFRAASVSYMNVPLLEEKEEGDEEEEDEDEHTPCETTQLVSKPSLHGTDDHNSTIKVVSRSRPRRRRSKKSHCVEEVAGMISIRKSTRPSLLDSFRNEAFEFEHPVHHHDEHLANHMHGSLLASLILLSALSVHSIFDGMSIGIAQNMSGVVDSTAAVLAHKAFAGYALGSSMVASEMKENHFLVLCLAFACCSVFGIFLGMIFEQLSDAEDSSPTGVIQAMVAGTFLYVAIVEIGMKELMMHRETAHVLPSGMHLAIHTMEWAKLVAFLVGYLLMSGLAIWI